jgi:hypothetical protein
LVDVSELRADDASDSRVAGDFAPNGKFDERVVFILQLLRNLNSIQGIADLFRSSWVDDADEILWVRGGRAEILLVECRFVNASTFSSTLSFSLLFRNF